MNTKKQYMAPNLDVVELYEDLMLTGASADGTNVEVVNGDNYYNEKDYGDIN